MELHSILRLMARNSTDNSGCGCIILIVIAIVFFVNKCNDSDHISEPSKESIHKREVAYQQHNVAEYPEKEELSDEDKRYLEESLSTGATPYSQYYGKNYKCPYNQCSSIRVTAPQESDIVVIIKQNNQNGKVVAHGYIRSGATYQFDIPDGTFQTFFYYGEGWNPNKEMKDGIHGGFVKDEIFSKDNPQEIYSGVMTYVLQLQRNGNFSTRESNKNEIF